MLSDINTKYLRWDLEQKVHNLSRVTLEAETRQELHQKYMAQLNELDSEEGVITISVSPEVAAQFEALQKQENVTEVVTNS